MTSLKIWSATANHGHYGNQILVTRISVDKEKAIRECLAEVIECAQDYDKKWVKKETEKIVDAVMKSNNYEQSDDGLRVVTWCEHLSFDAQITLNPK